MTVMASPIVVWDIQNLQAISRLLGSKNYRVDMSVDAV